MSRTHPTLPLQTQLLLFPPEAPFMTPAVLLPQIHQACLSPWSFMLALLEFTSHDAPMTTLLESLESLQCLLREAYHDHPQLQPYSPALCSPFSWHLLISNILYDLFVKFILQKYEKLLLLYKVKIRLLTQEFLSNLFAEDSKASE